MSTWQRWVFLFTLSALLASFLANTIFFCLFNLYNQEIYVRNSIKKVSVHVENVLPENQWLDFLYKKTHVKFSHDISIKEACRMDNCFDYTLCQSEFKVSGSTMFNFYNHTSIYSNVILLVYSFNHLCLAPIQYSVRYFKFVWRVKTYLFIVMLLHITTFRFCLMLNHTLIKENIVKFQCTFIFRHATLFLWLLVYFQALRPKTFLFVIF